MKKQKVVVTRNDGTKEHYEVSGKVFSSNRDKEQKEEGKVFCEGCPQLISIEDAIRKGLTTREEIKRNLTYIETRCVGFCIKRRTAMSDKPKLCTTKGIQSLLSYQ